MNKIPLYTSLLVSNLMLAACGGSDKNNTQHDIMSSISSSAMSSIATKTQLKYSINFSNLTAGQPFAPMAVVLHKSSYNIVDVGMPASLGLERLAEGGDPSAFITEAASNTATYRTTKGAGMILPGKNETISIDASLLDSEKGMLSLTILSMPANTNDAFTGINAIDVGNMTIGETKTIDTIAYDAGTEKNTETAATIPGPAAGGEGFNAMRDDTPSVVAAHLGVLTKDDGNAASVLTSIHRWDNPIGRITITRVAP
jgi:hypothetical protein